MESNIESIYSNNYADFFVSYCGNKAALKKYENFSTNIINFFYAIVHLPVGVMTDDVVAQRGYASIPSLLGLVSEASLEASGVTLVRRGTNFNLTGKGVLIGIADTGIDYTNPVFQYSDKTTRIASIWDQTIISDKVVENVVYGTEYTREQINEALKSEAPLSIVPSRDEIGHGTMIAGIAAGNEVVESGFSGVAPDSELVIVKLKPAKPYLKEFYRVPEDAIAYQENDLIFGLQYLIDYAAKVNKPIVLCITLDTSQYAHDGRGTTGNWLSIESSMPEVATLIAVGNEGISRRHFFGTITEEMEHETVELRVGEHERGFSMELWGDVPNTFTIDIRTPLGEYIPRIEMRLDETKKITFVLEQTIINVDYQLVESQSGDQLILLRFTNPTEGIWKINVYSRGTFPINFNMWLPINNFIGLDTYFVRSDPNTTLLSLACSLVPITVTAYDMENESFYSRSGKGYTRINVIKPDIAAPGVNILCPSLNHDFVRVTGTSAAVAHAVGVAALLFEWGIVRGKYPRMTTEDIKVFMIRGARRKADMVYPNYEWGYGILDIFNIFYKIIG